MTLNFMCRFYFLETNNDARLVEILLQEIDKEIAHKMGAICEICDSTTKCQEQLDRLRKEAVSKFYRGSHQVCLL